MKETLPLNTPETEYYPMMIYKKKSLVDLALNIHYIVGLMFGIYKYMDF